VDDDIDAYLEIEEINGLNGEDDSNGNEILNNDINDISKKYKISPLYKGYY